MADLPNEDAPQDPVSVIIRALEPIAPHNVMLSFVAAVQQSVQPPPPIQLPSQQSLPVIPVYSNVETGKPVNGMMSYRNFGNMVPTIPSRDDSFAGVGLGNSIPWRPAMDKERVPQEVQDSAYLVKNSPIADFATGREQSVQTIFF